MKSFFIALSVCAFSVAGAIAQNPPAGAPPVSESSPSDVSLTAGTMINASLNSSVDSKKAKLGMQVTAQTTEPVKSKDGRTVLPKGTKITGHVTQASSRDKEQGQATMVIQFDRAKLKDGQEMALTNVKIQALAAPVPEASSNFGSSPSYGAGAGSSPANSPSMSGSRGARPEGTSTTAPNVPNNQPFPDANSSASAAAPVNSSGPLPQNAKGVYGIDGLSLNAAPNAEGTLLTSTNKNVHLDSGTRLLLVVQTQNGASSPGR